MLMPSMITDRMFDSFFNDFARPVRRGVRYQMPSVNAMRTDIRETESGYELEMDLPGMKKENIKAQLKDGYMTITAATASDSEEKDEDGRYIRRERYAGSCSRSFFVGKDIGEEDIRARFEDGILRIFVPKKEALPVKEEENRILIEG
ncbi:MAG: Hsp20/alpha crystallin family protein [Lachnospiraceae bacterium]|nr:Hsp20/alpha crystallin family protein [Lachnospiraceae bacterium]